MIDADFHVEIADYVSDFSALRAVRDAVFVQEQGVPVELELDQFDPRCRHVLARDAEGRPIGTGRLSPQGRIGRMAVLRDWRGRGVGAALLQTLVDLARSLGFPIVELHAQVDAIGFYEHHAFECIGPEFVEAGIRHRGMRRTLDPFPEVPRAPLPPAQDSEELSLDSQAQTEALALQLVARAKRNLWLYSRDLEPKLYATAGMIEAFKRFALQARGGELRVLLHDPDAVMRDGHPLVTLAHRLPSRIALRVPQEEPDLQYAGAFLLNDTGGYLWRPVASRFEGTGNLHAPGKQRQLREYFVQVWERSLPDPRLRQLHL